MARQTPNLSPSFWPLIFAGASLCAALLALFLYGTRVATRRFRLEKLQVKSGFAISQAASQNLIKSSAQSSAQSSGQASTQSSGQASVQSAGQTSESSGTQPTTLKILHISDLHLQKGDHKKVEFIRAITDDHFDMVVLTGDIFQFSESFDFGPFLLSRQPRLGAYAVFGNHDYYDYSLVNKTIGRIFRKLRQPQVKKDISPHRRALEAGGFKVLVNECITLVEQNIFIVGIDYPGISTQDLSALMRQAPDREGLLKLALFHLPRHLEQLAAAGFDMVFGGHTHGGQIRLPGFGALITDSELDRSEASGLLRRGKTQFHISRGLGADPRSNIRLFCPPAATVIELTHNFNPPASLKTETQAPAVSINS